MEPLATKLGLRWFHRVTYVKIYGSAFGDEQLREIEEFRLLEKLVVTDTEISKAGIERFKQQRPACIVVVLKTPTS